jgi:hypothetical protein
MRGVMAEREDHSRARAVVVVLNGGITLDGEGENRRGEGRNGEGVVQETGENERVEVTTQSGQMK